MSQRERAEKRTRVNLKLTQLTHKLLKVYAAESEMTVQSAAEKLVIDGLKKEKGVAAMAGMVERSPGVWMNPGAANFETSRLGKDMAAAAAGNPVSPLYGRVPFVIPDSGSGIPAPGPKAAAVKPMPAKLVNEPPAELTDEEDAAMMVAMGLAPAPESTIAEPATTPTDDEPAEPEIEDGLFPEDDGSKPYIPPVPDAPIKSRGSPKPTVPKPATVPFKDLASVMSEWSPRERPAGNGASTNGNGHTAGPITAREYDVPSTWVDSEGATRASNLKRYGEDEDVEYWPPVKESGLEIDAPVDLSNVAPMRKQ